MTYSDALAYLDAHASYEKTGRIESPTTERMKTIVAAIDGYYVQNSVYPQSLVQLVQNKTLVQEKLLDAWKREIYYGAPAPDGVHPYYLVSFGKNGQEDGGAGDDIYVYPDTQ